jgi:zinc transporter ZupT
MFLTNSLNSKECFMALLVGMVASNLSCHILPEVFENDHVATIFVLLSLGGGFLLQYSLHRFLSPAKKSGNQFLLFLHLHNVTDGLTIGLAALNSLSFGLFMALAVMLHDVIHKIIGFSFLRAQGDKVKTALLKIATTFLSIASGVALMLMLKPNELASTLGSAFAAGSLLYISYLLIREMFHHHHGASSKHNTVFKILAFLTGILLMIGIIFLLEAVSPEHIH